MRLTAKPVIFGAPLLIAVGTFILLWVIFSGSGGPSSNFGLVWNVELTQRDSAGNILYNETLHNTLVGEGLDAAMERLIDESVLATIQGGVASESFAFDNIVLLHTDDDPSDGILASSILDPGIRGRRDRG